MATKPPMPTTPPGEPPSTIQTLLNTIGFDPKQVPPSQQVYFQVNDGLLFIVNSNGTNITVVITYRWLTPEGEIKEGAFNSPPFTGIGSFIIPVYEGWLLSFSIRQSSVLAAGQWAFAQAVIVRSPSLPTGRPQVGFLWQGYVPGAVANGWPGTPSKEITDGAGTIRSISGTTPAAGAEINEVVPSSRRWSLLSFHAFLTTSATVANRFPGFLVDDGVNQFFVSHSTLAQTATQTNGYTLMSAQPFFNDGQNNVILPGPGTMLLKPGFRIRTGTIALQAGDQYSAPQYLVQEWGLWDS